MCSQQDATHFFHHSSCHRVRFSLIPSSASPYLNYLQTIAQTEVQKCAVVDKLNHKEHIVVVEYKGRASRAASFPA